MTAIFSVIAVVISMIALVFSFIQHKSLFRLAWYKEVVEWAQRCTRTISRAGEWVSCECYDEIKRTDQRFEILCDLTSLIDEGRFVFENDRNNEYGLDKPTAYRGFRPDVLDWLVAVYDLVKKVNIDTATEKKDTEKKIITLKRRFVSEIQRIIEPKWYWNKATITPVSDKVDPRAKN